MALVYDETSVKQSFSGGTPISQWSSERVMAAWRVHLENRAYLRFMAKSGTYAERVQAGKELLTCARKLAFWERHLEFDKKVAAASQFEVGRKWSAPTARARR